MTLDLFTDIEKAFHGTLFYAYNLLETLWLLIRHPLAAPIRLVRRYRDRRERQVGPLTLLFTATLLALLGYDLLFEKTRLLEMDLTHLGDSLINYLLAAALVVVVIDVALRITVLSLGKAGRTRRDLMVRTATYSVGLLPFYWLALLTLLSSLPFPLPFLRNPFWLEDAFLGAVGMSLMALTAWPPASILGAFARPRRSRLAVAFIALALGVTMFFSPIGGYYAISLLEDSGFGVEVLSGECEIVLAENRIVMEATLLNPGPKGTMVDRAYLKLVSTNPEVKRRPLFDEALLLEVLFANPDPEAPNWLAPDRPRRAWLTGELRPGHLRDLESLKYPLADCKVVKIAGRRVRQHDLMFLSYRLEH